MDHPSLVTPQDLSPAEEKIAARAAKQKKLFVFLRDIRTELLDSAFQEELAGMYRDTFNWLGHAAHPVIACLAELTQHEVAPVMEQIGLSLFDAPSLKAALDIDWGDAEHKQPALQRLCDEWEALQTWIGAHVPVELKPPPVTAAINTLHALLVQALEPDPAGGGTQIREGVAKDRQISIEDEEMRHGRKSSAKRFDGYKRHLARDLDEQWILAAAT